MLRPLRSGNRSSAQPLCAKFQRSQKGGQRAPPVMSFPCQQAGPGCRRGARTGHTVTVTPPPPATLSHRDPSSSPPTPSQNLKLEIRVARTNGRFKIFMTFNSLNLKLKRCVCHPSYGACHSGEPLSCIQLPVPWKCSCPFGCVPWTPIFISGPCLHRTHNRLSVHMWHMLLGTCVIVPTSAHGWPIVCYRTDHVLRQPNSYLGFHWCSSQNLGFAFPNISDLLFTVI